MTLYAELLMKVSINHCILDKIQQSRWMSSNRLKLNPLKSELIWLHSSRRNSTFLQKDIVLFGSPITPVNVVRNLGVILDENMTMSEHIA